MSKTTPALVASYADRMQRIKEDIKGLQEDLKDMKAEMKGHGITAKAIENLVAIRMKDKAKADAQIELFQDMLMYAPFCGVTMDLVQPDPAPTPEPTPLEKAIAAKGETSVTIDGDAVEVGTPDECHAAAVAACGQKLGGHVGGYDPHTGEVDPEDGEPQGGGSTRPALTLAKRLASGDPALTKGLRGTEIEITPSPLVPWPADVPKHFDLTGGAGGGAA